MLAELHNKISQVGTNLSDRMEDQLTGNFFGTLRYLPFQLGLGPVLLKTRFLLPAMTETFQKTISAVKDYHVHYQFWKWLGNGEIDLLIETDNALIGIEVKYLSGISTDDGVDFSTDYNQENSEHQLYRYAQYLHEYQTNKKKFLLFLAEATMQVAVEQDISSRKLLDRFDSVAFGSFSWQDNLQTLQEINEYSLEAWQKLIVIDLQALLIKKGFEQFEGISNGIRDDLITSAAFVFKEVHSSRDTVVREELHYEFRE